MVIALSVFSLTIGGLVVVSLGNEALATSTEMQAELRVETQSALDKARENALTDWDTVSSWQEDDAVFSRSFVFEDISPCLKDVVAHVSFVAPRLQHQGYEQTALVFESSRMSDVGNDCPAYLGNGDWSKPLHVLSQSIMSPGTAVADVDVVGHHAYVALDSSSTPSADLAVLNMDALLKGLPALESTLHTGPGIVALDAINDYVFAATVSRNAQLQIIDVHDPNAPVLTSSLKLPGIYTDATIGQSIFYLHNRVYLGTNKSQIGEFHVIDVSDPTHPQELGAYEVGAGVNSIFVKGEFAYIATPNAEELTILDVHDPAVISRVGGFDAPMGLGNGKVVAGLGTRLYLGRTVGARELYVLDITDPRTPLEVSSYDVNASVYDLRITGSKVFLMTSDTFREFQVFNSLRSGMIQKVNEIDLPARSKSLDFFSDGLVIFDETVGEIRAITPEP
jgi:hypothetical protein